MNLLLQVCIERSNHPNANFDFTMSCLFPDYLDCTYLLSHLLFILLLAESERVNYSGQSAEN